MRTRLVTRSSHRIGMCAGALASDQGASETLLIRGEVASHERVALELCERLAARHQRGRDASRPLRIHELSSRDCMASGGVRRRAKCLQQTPPLLAKRLHLSNEVNARTRTPSSRFSATGVKRQATRALRAHMLQTCVKEETRAGALARRTRTPALIEAAVDAHRTRVAFNDLWRQRLFQRVIEKPHHVCCRVEVQRR